MILINLLLFSALWQLQAPKRGFWKPKAFSVTALWHCWKRENEKSKRSAHFLPAAVQHHSMQQLLLTSALSLAERCEQTLLMFSVTQSCVSRVLPCSCLLSLSRAYSSGFALSKDLSFLLISEQFMPVCEIPHEQSFSLRSCKGQAKLSLPGRTLA